MYYYFKGERNYGQGSPLWNFGPYIRMFYREESPALQKPSLFCLQISLADEREPWL